MTKFRKLIVTPGVHRVGRLDGRQEMVAITPERISEWVENTNKLLSWGVSIPAPFAHQDKNLHFPLPTIRLGDENNSLADAYHSPSSPSLSWDASINGGFWEDPFEIDPETGGLVGYVSSPGDDSDPNTPAGKIGKLVKETSVLVMGPRKVVDKEGNIREIGEHLAHVAMCLHPAQPGQKNFEPVPVSEELALAMSFAMSDLVSESVVPQVGKPPKDNELLETISLLAEIAYVALPPDTTRENFITNLNVCLRQKAADQKESEQKMASLEQRPPDAETKSPSMTMNQTVKEPDLATTLLMNNLVKSKRKSLRERIDALVSSGRVKKTYADQKLYPQVEALAMSPDQVLASNGEAPRLPIDDIVEALEQTMPLTGTSLVEDPTSSFTTPPDAQVEELPEEMQDSLSDELADQVIKTAFNYSGAPF